MRLAALIHDPSLNEERELLDAVSAAAGIALENGRLQAELRARLEELRGSRQRVVEAGQEERKRLERNLHDGAQQRLVALLLDLRLLERRLGDDPDSRAQIDRARQEITLSLGELRDIAHGLHPAVVTGHGLEVALASLVANAPLPVELKVELDERVDEPVEVAAYYVVSESLANNGKHAQSGFFTLDAVSPDGGWAYLIQYAGENVLDYRVRALDTATGTLAARDVVDPRSPGEQMGGLPMTRATSHDGRFAYTLYGGGEETFIHALDTAGRTAACIDLDMLAPDSDLTGYSLRVGPDGGRIGVRAPDRSPVATVDARTFAVSEPGRPPEPAPQAPRHASTEPADGNGFPWLALVLAAGLAGAWALGVAIARRRFA